MWRRYPPKVLTVRTPLSKQYLDCSTGPLVAKLRCFDVLAHDFTYLLTDFQDFHVLSYELITINLSRYGTVVV